MRRESRIAEGFLINTPKAPPRQELSRLFVQSIHPTAPAVDIAKRAEYLAVPVIVLGEYRMGIARSRHRATYENWLSEWVSAVAVLDIDEETTHFYAEIGLELGKKGKPIAANDLWIAAACRQHELPLLSHDAHFDLVSGLRRLDW